MRSNSEILSYIASFAPLAWAMDYDNVGLLVGDSNGVTRRALLALDASEHVLEEAIEGNFDLLITHHPLIFHPLYRLTSDDPIASRVLMLVRHNISLISMHTNLDAARDGVNDALARALGLNDIRDFENRDKREGIPSIGRVGIIEETPGEEFVRFVIERLRAEGARYVLPRKNCHRIAVGGGSCADYIDDAVSAGCDTLVTADVKYHEFTHAEDVGLNLIDAGHFATENVVIRPLAEKLRIAFPDVEFVVSHASADPIKVMKYERN